MNCNCNCYYCYETHHGKRISKEVVDNIKNYIKSNIRHIKHLHIDWFGGEPLLETEAIRDISGFSLTVCREEKIGFSASITTNAFFLDFANCRLLKDAGIKEIHVTIDGSKKMHDRIRITKKQEETFDLIVNNIRSFVEYDEGNSALIRIHLHSLEDEELEGIIDTMMLFEEYKDRVSFYFRDLFSSSTDTWDVNAAKANRVKEDREEISKVIMYLMKKSLEAGYKLPLFLCKRKFYYCEAENDNKWVIDPEGYLYKCTVAIEKERAVGKLLPNGMQFNNRYALWKKKMLSGRIYSCKECSLFPFCWGMCAYCHYQNQTEEKLQILREKCSDQVQISV